MIYDPDKHHRRSNRLANYDYSKTGLYFVTLCTRGRECLFGDIINGEMILNDFGRIVQEEWCRSGTIRQEIELGEYIIMPNHLHGIIIISHPANAGAFGERPQQGCRSCKTVLKPKTLGSLMSGFQSSVTRRINQIRKTPGISVWQRNYHDRIIRDERDLNRIRDYIQNNPLNWHQDKENPLNKT